LDFEISPLSFYQINHACASAIYRRAAELAELSPEDVLIDFYCGTGTIGLSMASRVKTLYGIEIVPDAVKDAKINAEINGVNNIDFFCMDASKGAQAIIRSKIKADAMIIDPPRKGCSRDTIDAIVKIAPQRLVYVSCDPATLARDVKILSEEGYQLCSVQPVDMFPHTTHVETIVLLQ
jgi:23S rRNA (uracil1939-C5)-methyltransferase